MENLFFRFLKKVFTLRMQNYKTKVEYFSKYLEESIHKKMLSTYDYTKKNDT